MDHRDRQEEEKMEACQSLTTLMDHRDRQEEEKREACYLAAHSMQVPVGSAKWAVLSLPIDVVTVLEL
jgi:catabolite regulation protein CreA